MPKQTEAELAEQPLSCLTPRSIAYFGNRPMDYSSTAGRLNFKALHLFNESPLAAANVSKSELRRNWRSGILLLHAAAAPREERHTLLHTNGKLLIVDDEPSIRMSLSHVFSGLGHRVRSAVDGLSALIEIRKELPDILLSDLNMPGVSGFELLSVVRCQFATIQVIAMSAAFSGGAVPPGVAADAFYEKGTSLRPLLQVVKTMTEAERPRSLDRRGSWEHIWAPGTAERRT